MSERIDKNDGETSKAQPFERATGQVERATQDLSEREQAKSRQADLHALGSDKPDAEGQAPPARGPDDQATDDDGADEDERATSTAKPITAYNSQ